MKIQRYTMPPQVQRKLSSPVADPKVPALVDSRLLPAFALPGQAGTDPAFETFTKALKGYAFGQAGAQPLTVKVVPGLLNAALPPGAGADAEIPLRLALVHAEDALKAEIGPGAFSAVSLVVTVPGTVGKLLDADASAFDRSLAGAKLVQGCARVMETVWPQLAPWNAHLGLAIKIAETGKLTYLGYQAATA